MKKKTNLLKIVVGIACVLLMVSCNLFWDEPEPYPVEVAYTRMDKIKGKRWRLVDIVRDSVSYEHLV